MCGLCYLNIYYILIGEGRFIVVTYHKQSKVADQASLYIGIEIAHVSTINLLEQQQCMYSSHSKDTRG